MRLYLYGHHWLCRVCLCLSVHVCLCMVCLCVCVRPIQEVAKQMPPSSPFSASYHPPHKQAKD